MQVINKAAGHVIGCEKGALLGVRVKGRFFDLPLEFQ
jgi:hypothetical protein